MKWATLFAAYLPAVLSGVVGVENALHGTPGATKKQIVIDVIKAGAIAAGQAPNANVQGLGVMVDSVVSVLNQSGVFQKSVPTVREIVK